MGGSYSFMASQNQTKIRIRIIIIIIITNKPKTSPESSCKSIIHLFFSILYVLKVNNDQ